MKKSVDLLDQKTLYLSIEFKRLDKTTEGLIQSCVDLLEGSKDSAERVDLKLRKKSISLQGSLKTLMSHIRCFYALVEQRALI